jgi:Carboxypeptidase regulatory-like domain
MFASMPIAVSGEDIPDIQITFAPAAGLSGTATLENTQTTSPPPLSQFRVSAPPSDFDGSGNGQTQPDARTGAFNIDGLAPGEHILQTQAPRGWALKSATVDGRESSDLPFDLRSGQKLTNVTLVFTDKITEIDGTVADAKGSPLTEFTVLAFPDDQSLWRPQSRHIMTARPDQNGTFQIRGLPAGQYYLALIDPSEPGEWFEPSFLDAQRSGAKHFQLGNGETRTEDFAVSR